MGRYIVEYSQDRKGPWYKVSTNPTVDSAGYDLSLSFLELKNAEKGVIARSSHFQNPYYRIWDKELGKAVSVWRNGTMIMVGTKSDRQTPDEQANPEQEGGSMKLSTTLTVPRQKVIDAIQANIDKSEEEFKATQAKAVEARKADVAFIHLLSDAQIAAAIKKLYGDSWTDWATSSDDKKLDKLKTKVVMPDDPTFVADPLALKLISVLQAATDENLMVSADDDLYRYL